MKFSILIPAYNVENYISDTINSVLLSEYNDYEILVYEDCSTDDTKKVITDLYSANKKIKCIFGKQNFGVSHARNELIKHSKGDYFIFLDGDDKIDKNLLLNIANILELNKNTDIIHYNIIEIKEGIPNYDIKRSEFYNYSGEDAFLNLFYYNYNISESLCSYAISRKYYNSLNYSFLTGTVHEDFRLAPLILIKASSVISLKLDGYYYFKHDSSITTKRSKGYALKRTLDIIEHYKFQISEIKKMDFKNNKNKNAFLNFTSSSVIFYISNLSKKDRKEVFKKITKRSILKNYNPANFNEKIKKMVFRINIDLYKYIFYK